MILKSKLSLMQYIACVFIIFLFFFLNHYTLLVADDFNYSMGINSISDIVASQYNHYFNWGGRSIAHFLVQFWLLVGKPVFNIANTIVYGIFIFLIHFHITGNIKNFKAWFYIVLNIVFWFLIPVWGQNFIWLTGSCNYLWTTTIILLFLVPYRLKHDNSECQIKLWCSLLFFFLGMLAGWSNENSGAAVLFLLIAYITMKVYKRDKLFLFEILGFLGFLIGFILLILAPGNYVRAEAIEQMSNNDSSFIMYMIIRFFSITLNSIENNSLLILIFSIFFVFDSWRGVHTPPFRAPKKGMYPESDTYKEQHTLSLQGGVVDSLFNKKYKLNNFSYLYIFASLAGLYSMILSPAFPSRAYFIVYVFGVISLGSILEQMQLRIPSMIKRNFPMLIIFAVLILSSSFMQAGKNTIGNYIRWYNRIVQIQTEREDGRFIIEVNAINRTSRHTAMYELEDVEEDNNNWTNNVISQYFGIESIILRSETPDRISFGRKTLHQLLVPPWSIIKNIRTPHSLTK